MITMDSCKEDKKARQSLSFLKRIFSKYPSRDFTIRLWDGSTLAQEPGCTRRFTLMINQPGALRKLFWHPTQLKLGEAFIFKDIDIEGDLEAALKLPEVMTGIHIKWREKISYAKWLLSLPSTDKGYKAHSMAPANGGSAARERVRKAISFHYDLPVSFWRQVLNEPLQYSCAYFHTWEENLEIAQTHKLDYICRKLMLKPGETLLDVGCGWGGLILHAARNYGVNALGVTLSREQAEFARDQIREAGLSSRCHVELIDFRDLTGWERFDKIASVGSVEHAHSYINEYFKSAWRLLARGGLFLNHGISSTFQYPLPPAQHSFANQYVFPDGEMDPLSVTLGIAERTGFEIRDVENLREHYAQTLRLWVENLESRQHDIRRVTGEIIWRIFKLYMTASANNFSKGNLNLFQTLLTKADRGHMPLPATRKGWYL